MDKKAKLKDVLLSIAAALITLFIYHLVGKGLDLIIKDDFVKVFLAELVFAIMVVAVVILFKKREIFKSDRKLLKSGWMSGMFFYLIILYFGITGIAEVLDASITFVQFLLMVGQVILVGFCEETLFRGLVQRSFHNYFGEDSVKHVYLAVILSGLIFGLAHLVNMDRGNPIMAAVYQAGVNCFSGMLFCAVYFRTGKNLKYLIFLHALYDFVAMIANGRLSGKSLDNVLATGGDMEAKTVAVGILFQAAIYLIPTFIVLRPKKVKPLLSAGAETAGEAAAN